ncbi:DNA repair protein RadA [Lentilactobacillus hilgardii DSM 20176 = ATCC 8290]|uniref:DNA repair protein RadA n=1 Tax=Lentilactobacillus hilgardii (strain ATCC 8290 / DSM 20176 / CCUG 30140 / JCM 1155 / KCTC 3500 / NBRC 15886 / NCIMB 8040 / NRRL B-1843 / 9) TaxID=1423757 RepID=C0XFZ8_LENH9|nr:DNA repair protein RadA [Lentilactobacillus hilgardii DSM 20176 = ATCC 8290]KRK56426.1 DNA repair protein RadA [Lentilactobacillus hilgardii DSM 20176 = ATCC 8290]
MVEETIAPKSNSTRTAGLRRTGVDEVKPEPLSSVTFQSEPRFKTGMEELNRVLGGGVVPGSLILIGGDPGIGKSTLMLQVSGQLSRSGKILYVSGEESASQIKMRADRLDVDSKQLYVFPETDMNVIKSTISDMKPDAVVIDSVQTMQIPELQSATGSVAQIREVTADLMNIAKGQGITVFVVGHVTKGGAIAGPKILEHMVDTVLYFEGDLHHSYRILRTVKNRFGSTNELGVFEMMTDGLHEVTNPSEIFLEERLKDATGSAIVVSMEGTRPILVEIQALVTASVFGNATRTATGLDRNRVSLIMAVLEKRAGLLLQNQDAYLKAAGGVKLDEPAIDLAIAVSIASSYKNRGTSPTECYVGELGLTGEVRRVTRIEQRVSEAQKLGFKRVLVPANNLQGWTPPKGIDVVGVSTLSQALKLALG